ncbi:MAG: hypothetical protein KF708_06840 [Pirellulales bacterium]|nr:hypothetical protein [Pirellulales bacterium]
MSSSVPEMPFSLVCESCDAGMELCSQSQAEAAGWTDIQPAPDLPMANYLGRCPECQRAVDEMS